MSYLSVVFALFMSQGSGLTGMSWWDLFLDNLVIVETWFYHASWWIWVILVVLATLALLAVALLYGREALTGCGCLIAPVAIFVLFYPLFEWITMRLAIGMAESVTPEGVINQGQLILNAVIYAMIGTG